MASQRKRATALLEETTSSSSTAAALEALIFSQHRADGTSAASYSKAVRRVVAATRCAAGSGGALPAADDQEALKAFVEGALEPAAQTLGRREVREIRVVRASDNQGAPSRLEPLLASAWAVPLLGCCLAPSA